MKKEIHHIIQEKELIDIVFTNRNKAYGAYEIRKSYYKHLTIGLICTIGIVAIWFLLYFAVLNDFLPKPPSIKTSTVHLKEYKLPPAIKTTKHANKYSSDKPKFKSHPILEEISSSAPVSQPYSIQNNEMIINKLPEKLEIQTPPPTEKKSDENIFKRPDKNLEKKEEIIDPLFDIATVKVTSLPQFLGGNVGWANFLKRNLNMYASLRKGAMPATYIVIIGFYVHADSSVSDFKIVKDPGYGMGEEGLRVLKMSGKWIPGTKNNKPITFAQLQTIVFKVTE
ncbi:energy transducer TonB [Rhizosphaericola mali]|uniref:Energy transducer TonB n=1 Tax=Rhizosphaericola mali TaxID=2545455 RepID=A0A5P2GG49_9BACT|nr:hypothetical protein [Rhizosphaericola mali]QES90671.1 hypothetical protein E0W69_019095 [Rhizosphaericola mali]